MWSIVDQNVVMQHMTIQICTIVAIPFNGIQAADLSYNELHINSTNKNCKVCHVAHISDFNFYYTTLMTISRFNLVPMLSENYCFLKQRILTIQITEIMMCQQMQQLQSPLSSFFPYH